MSDLNSPVGISSARLIQHLEHVRRYFLQRQDHQCWYCSAPFGDGLDAPHLDHKHPLSRGGEDSMRNVVMACAYCNQEKGRRTVEEYRAEIICRHDFEPDYRFPGERA